MQDKPLGKFGQNQKNPQARLRILETTDLHASLLPYDYFADLPSPGTGLGPAASLIRSLRADADNSVLFDNGDFLQGNPMADWIARDSGFRRGDTHPMIAAMNTLDYDAGTLGNHEFDYGLTFLTDALMQASFPITSANVLVQLGQTPAFDRPLCPPYLLLDRQITDIDGGQHTIRIGVIGFAPPQLIDWNRIVLQGQIAARSSLEAARHYIPVMRQAGADIVVALSHSGIEIDQDGIQPGDDKENISVRLASVDGIDVVLTGHTHKIFPGPGMPTTPSIDGTRGSLHGKPAVMAASHGTHVGVIDLVLERRDGHWSVASHKVRVAQVNAAKGTDHPDTCWPVDVQVQAAAAIAHDKVLTMIRQPIGETKVALQSYFALVAPDLTVQLVAEAQSAHAATVLTATQWAGLPILSAVAPSKAGGLSGAMNYINIAPGPLQMRHAAELSVFPNSICIQTITGAVLHDWLEHSARLFAQITPGLADQPLLNPGFACYNFDVIDGVTYDIDPSRHSRADLQGQPFGSDTARVQNLCHSGVPVTATQGFAIVTNSYRVGGGGGFSMAGRAQVIHHSTENTRDIVIRHLRHASPLTGMPRRIWRFAPLPETSVWFDSAAAGLPFLGSVHGQIIQDAGPRPDQMRRFRLMF